MGLRGEGGGEGGVEDEGEGEGEDGAEGSHKVKGWPPVKLFNRLK